MVTALEAKSGVAGPPITLLEDMREGRAALRAEKTGWQEQTTSAPSGLHPRVAGP